MLRVRDTLSKKLNYEPFGENKNLLIRRQSVKSLPPNLYSTSGSPICYSVSEENDDAECRFSWNEIFYDNRKNDFMNILIRHGQTGVFLIRPKLQQTASNDHEHTLCTVYNGELQKYAIQQSSNGEYQLTYRKNEPCFIDIPHLCHYYTINSLSVVKGNVTKEFYLTSPYGKADDLYE